MNLVSCRVEALPQSGRQRVRTAAHGLKSLHLTHSIRINSRLVFEVERDGSEDLRESEGFEFAQGSAFGEKSLIETLGN